MAKSKIEWCDAVWNPITGCSSVSLGCDHCWARAMAHRFHRSFEPTFHPERLNDPLKWRKPRKIFVCSVGDLFHPGYSPGWVAKTLEVAYQAPQHTYFFLTKRPSIMSNFQYFARGLARDNFWLGVSVENQETADERIPILLQIPAAHRFVSIEPMLGPIILNNYLPHWCSSCYMWHSSMACFWNELHPVDVHNNRLDWVILGGETGHSSRPMNPDWARSVRDQCRAAGVPFFFKQMGGRRKQLTPKDLMVREWPEKLGREDGNR